MMQSFLGKISGDTELEEPFYCRATQNPEDIIWEGSDTEQSPEEIKEKRLRYEYQAQRYQRGHIPVLQSASLRGPFDHGWINPWRYRPRKEEGWWKPGQEMLFTRENVMRRAKTHGRGHYTPVQALAWCRADAEAEAVAVEDAELQADAETTASENESNLDELQAADVLEDQEVMEGKEHVQNVQDIEEAEEDMAEPHQEDIPEHYERTFNSGPAPSSIHAKTHVTKTRRRDDLKAVTGGKRPVDVQWLKGSYVSKRARWDSPAAPSPTPMPLFQSEWDRRRREVPKRSLLSTRTPSYPPPNPRTPATHWSHEAQHRDSYHPSEISVQKPLGRMSSFSEDSEDYEPQQPDTLPRRPHSNATPYHPPMIDLTMTSNSSSNSLPELPQKSDPMEEDISFVTDIAPSSRNLEKFQFKKKRRKSSRRSPDSDKNRHGETIFSALVKNIDKNSDDEPRALLLLQTRSPNEDEEHSSPNILTVPKTTSLDTILDVSIAPGHSQSNQRSTMEANISLGDARPAIPDEVQPRSASTRAHGLLAGRIEQNARADGVSSSAKPPTQHPLSLLALDTPVKLSPFTMKFYQGIGTLDAIMAEDNMALSPEIIAHDNSATAQPMASDLESPVQDNQENSRTAVNVSVSSTRCIQPDGNGPESTNSAVQALIPGISQIKVNFTPVNAGPAKFSSVKTNQRDLENNEFTPRAPLYDSPISSVHVSPKLPTLRRPMSGHRAVSVLKALHGVGYGEDDSTQSWNSTAPEALKTPAKDSPEPDVDEVQHRDAALGDLLPAVAPEIASQAAYEGLHKTEVEIEEVKIITEVVPEIAQYSLHETEAELKDPKTSSKTNCQSDSNRENNPSQESVDVDGPQQDVNNNEAADDEDDENRSLPDEEQSSWQGCSSPQSPWATLNALPPPRSISKSVEAASFKGIAGENFPSQEHSSDVSEETDSGWQLEVAQKLDEMDEENEPEHDYGWQPFERPATPELIPFKKFMTPTPSPESSNRIGRDNDELPNTQQIIEAATTNPWASALRKRTSRKSMKRVSFRVLATKDTGESQPDSSSTPRRRSPPPWQHSNKESEQEGSADGTSAADIFGRHSLAPDGVGGYRPKLRNSPLKHLSSPAVGGMAEAFIAADREASIERGRQILLDKTPLRHLKSMSQATNLASFGKKWEPPNSCTTRGTSEAPPRTIDYSDDMGDNLDEFLGEGGILEEWSVEAELKKTTQSNLGTDNRRSIFGVMSSGW